MGVQQSRQTNGSSQNGGGGGARKDEREDCVPCFFLGTYFSKHLPGRSNDPIGTPLPETPLFQRKRRQQAVKAAMQKDEDPVFSSKYGGLEKETATMFPPQNSQNNRSSKFQEEPEEEVAADPEASAQVHEGPNCENEMHAKYQLMEVLGVGSTSTVHRCVRKTTDEHFACKIIDCQLIEERFQGMMQQFQTEIEALRQLKHPGIIRLYDVYITGERIFIVMELMEGGELFDYVVQKGTLTEEEASRIVRMVTSAMVYMHSMNIIHRDLKPENLLLKATPKGPHDEIEVKIIDFGLSKAMEEQVASTFLGTRGYLAPEMLQRRDYTRAVDTWALGVIVFVLVCGCLPFDDDSATVPSDDLVRTKFVLRFPRWAKNLSPSAKSLLSHLLDVNPRTRFTAEQALEHPWTQGQTAPKGNLLASPGRIRKSPLLGSKGSGGRGGGGRKYTPGGGTYIPPQRTPPTPSKPSPQIRKQSI